MKIQVVVTEKQASDIAKLSKETNTPMSKLIKNVLYDAGIIKKDILPIETEYKKSISIHNQCCAWCGVKGEELFLLIDEEYKEILAYCRDCYTKNKS